MTFLTRLSAACLTGVLSLWLPNSAYADDRALRSALDAARAHQWQAIDEASIDQHVLSGYIDYHRLKARLPGLSPEQVQHFIDTHDDSPLSVWMRDVAIGAYGQAGRFNELREISGGNAPNGVARQCYFYRAYLGIDNQKAIDGGRALWNVGRSQDNACDPLFDALRAQGAIGDAQIWSRLIKAWEAGNDGLANYLSDLLSPSWQPAASTYEQLSKTPERIATVDQKAFSRPVLDSLFEAAFHSLTRQNTQTALTLWQRLGPNAPVTAETRKAIEHDLAFYTLVRDHDENFDWVDATLTSLNQEDLFELRVRTALARGQWAIVKRWVERMPDEQRTDARWQYWLARAEQALGQESQALEHYQAAATQRSFFGFAAADKVGRPYDLNQDQRDKALYALAELDKLPAIQRINALERIGESGLARTEWFYLIDRSTGERVYELAHYALQHEWFDLAVFTSIRSKQWDALSWRFPPAYAELFKHQARENNVSPYLLMGIARRESAFNPEARSSAGALGLMQLMPGTARHVSKRKNLPYEGPASLTQVVPNVQLGSAYIKSMLDRYRGNRVAAIAAYNAGPGRVDRWLTQGNQPFDLFVESIPFRETRDYVQAVLAYQVIFESLAKGTTQDVAMMSAQERQIRYDSALLAHRND
ncbi:transglycosylase SLT domain-containing protein [Larsenimonas suaedae]|uniref:Transglycosylase SLT domain-containing protein n=1 Tax=Larsenimonas suaedae TaxID=1851019 RepID=A0ABU1GXI9_9GAMM|nr:transglycosylase SLT domain-containing protein [Larsenimonas suaedae]MCM2971462.1 transglycosylase SLT domain-containing protein [Larsenimonas suaedae]MDR5896718.1 transglycosylase SLT domain-containing protein [Larsenimonas suaedae]